MIKKTPKQSTLQGIKSLFVGLRVTGHNFVMPQITTHYPRQEVDNLVTYRGHIELVPKEDDPMTSKCILCGQCAKACPSNCIELVIRKEEVEPPPAAEAQPDADKEEAPPKPAPKKKVKRILEAFILDYNMCSLCGQCVQTCPVDSLEFSTNSYLAGFTREEFVFELLERMRKKYKASSSG